MNTDDPNYEAKVRSLAGKLEAAFGEPVDVDVGVIEDRTMPSSIAADKMGNNPSAQIKL